MALAVAVGVPLMVAVEALNDKPVGNDPELVTTRNRVLCHQWRRGLRCRTCPSSPLGSDELVIVKVLEAEAEMVSVRLTDLLSTGLLESRNRKH